MNERLRALARFASSMRSDWDVMATHGAIDAAMRRRKGTSVNDLVIAVGYAISELTLLSLAEALSDDSHDCWKLADMARVDVNGVWHASRRDKTILMQAREDRKKANPKASHDGYVRATAVARQLREEKAAREAALSTASGA